MKLSCQDCGGPNHFFIRCVDCRNVSCGDCYAMCSCEAIVCHACYKRHQKKCSNCEELLHGHPNPCCEEEELCDTCEDEEAAVPCDTCENHKWLCNGCFVYCSCGMRMCHECSKRGDRCEQCGIRLCWYCSKPSYCKTCN